LRHCKINLVRQQVPTMLNKPEQPPAEKREAVVIKKYANRRLYNTETSTYVTLEDLATMVRSDRDFVVYDAKTGDDLTHSVLTQIIVDQESRPGGQTMLPIPFLRQLIRFYDDNISRMVPSYLQLSMETLVREQERFRTQFANALSSPTAAFEAYQEQARKNLAIFEQAMSMWSPFAASMAAQHGKPVEGQNGVSPVRPAPTPVPQPAGGRDEPRDELTELKTQLAAMQAKIEQLSQRGN
jgi:polyhydroxyalkanoate synthesis repressor PhaR